MPKTLRQLTLEERCAIRNILVYVKQLPGHFFLADQKAPFVLKMKIKADEAKTLLEVL